jgi:hypothetical protein
MASATQRVPFLESTLQHGVGMALGGHERMFSCLHNPHCFQAYSAGRLGC